MKLVRWRWRGDNRARQGLTSLIALWPPRPSGSSSCSNTLPCLPGTTSSLWAPSRTRLRPRGTWPAMSDFTAVTHRRAGPGRHYASAANSSESSHSPSTTPMAATTGSADAAASSSSSLAGHEAWVDPPHIAAAKEQLRKSLQDLYAELGVPPTADSAAIAAAYNERGARLAADPDFATNPDLRDQLRRLKSATEVLLDGQRRLEYDAHRRSVQEALKRLEVDPEWVRGKEKMTKVGRTFFFSKQVWALAIFAGMMGVFVYMVLEILHTREQQLSSQDRHPLRSRQHAALDRSHPTAKSTQPPSSPEEAAQKKP